MRDQIGILFVGWRPDNGMKMERALERGASSGVAARQGAQAFVRKLSNGSCLETDDKLKLAGLIVKTKSFPLGVNLFHEGEERRYLALVADGWACHYKLMADGRRQIISLLLAGDLCQPFGALPGHMTDSLIALTPLTVAYFSAIDLREICKTNPRIERALWWDLQFMKESQNELIASLGRRDALERLAYLYCELYFRLGAVGLADRPEFAFPMTQTAVADLLGLSPVHVNRSLKSLRSQGLVSLRGRILRIEQLPQLIDLCGFQLANYHLKSDGRWSRSGEFF